MSVTVKRIFFLFPKRVSSPFFGKCINYITFKYLIIKMEDNMMKLNKLILVSIFLLAVISLSPLCASEDIASADLALNDSAEVNEITRDDVAGDGDLDSDLNVDFKQIMMSDEEGNITITAAKDITGNLNLEFEGESSNIKLDDNGKYTLFFKELSEGDHPILVKLTNDTKYRDAESSHYIHVYRAINITPKIPSAVFNNNPTTITFEGPIVNSTTGLSARIDGEWFDGYYYHSGSGEVKIKSKNLGVQTVDYFYENTEDNVMAKGSFNITVLPKPKIKAGSLTMTDIENKNYKIRLVDAHGKPMTGKKLTVYIDLTKLKTVKTDKNGYASVKIKGSDVYDSNIDITYKTLKVTKNLVVKRVLKEITSFKKTNAKSVTFQLKTFKVNGKYLTGKKVVFKFNKKTYKVKIDKKGIAKKTVKQTAFSKCKVGKVYTLKATLGDSTFTSNYKFLKVKPKVSYVSGMYAVGKQ